MDEAVQLAKRAGEETLSPATANAYLTSLLSLLGWAVNQGYAKTNPVSGMQFSDPVKDKDKRNPFSSKDLNSIFAAPIFTGMKLELTRKSTFRGGQSLNGMNLFKSPSGKIAQLKSIIITELETYYLKFQNEPCSYIQKFSSIYNLFGWNVILKHQGHQRAHIHTGGWLSGVIYLEVVPSLVKDEGAIEFSFNGKHYSNINSPKLTYQPESGGIVFFPSFLHHRTIPFTTDADRIIVSFDLMREVAKH